MKGGELSATSSGVINTATAPLKLLKKNGVVMSHFISEGKLKA